VRPRVWLDAAAGQALVPVGQLILAGAGGDHRTLSFLPEAILDALEDSPLALPQLVEDSGIYSEAQLIVVVTTYKYIN
jgi:hypothetical protein